MPLAPVPFFSRYLNMRDSKFFLPHLWVRQDGSLPSSWFHQSFPLDIPFVLEAPLTSPQLVSQMRRSSLRQWAVGLLVVHLFNPGPLSFYLINFPSPSVFLTS